MGYNIRDKPWWSLILSFLSRGRDNAKKRYIVYYDAPTRDNTSPSALFLIRGKVVAKQGCASSMRSLAALRIII